MSSKILQNIFKKEVNDFQKEFNHEIITFLFCNGPHGLGHIVEGI